MCEVKRKRSPNWLPSEKKLLIELVEKHYEAAENKKLDTASLSAKQAEWRKIAVEYNIQTSHIQRDAKILKAQWEGMKKAAKKEASLARNRNIDTGGPDVEKEDPIYTNICNSRIISILQMNGERINISNDSDSMATVQSDGEAVKGRQSELEPDLSSSCMKGMDIKKEFADKGNIEIEIDPLKLKPGLLEDMSLSMGSCTSADSEIKDWVDFTSQMSTPLSVQSKTTKISSLESVHEQQIIIAAEEAEGRKTMSKLDIEIKREILKQEKLKTKLLLLELRRKRKILRKIQ